MFAYKLYYTIIIGERTSYAMNVSSAHLLLFTILMMMIFSTYAKQCHKGRSELSVLTEASRAKLGEDGKLNFTQLVNKYGHTAEQYDVVTEDGYILTLFHIPGKKPPVLLCHGLLDSSDTYVMRGKTSLAITLAEAGYDVWVSNNRGNLYGRRHVKLNPDTDKSFWDYSFHEIGFYDLPAIIDFVCQKSGAESISTIGHSQGTSAHFVLTSLRPEYNAKIKVFIALAPIAFMNNVGEPVSLLADAGPEIATVVLGAGIVELFQNHNVLSDVFTLVCTQGIISYDLCADALIFLIAGFDNEELEPNYVEKVALGHFPRGTSAKSLVHYAQVMTRHSFAPYDYGLENTIKYGCLSPPEYNLKAVTMNVALFPGKADLLGTVKDVEHLSTVLPNVVHYEVMKPAEWGHLAFVSGKNMPKYLYPSIFKLLNKYN